MRTSFRFSSTLLLLVVLFITSCGEKTEIVNPTQTPTVINNPEAVLQPYFERFEQEGAARGWSVDLEAAEIIGEIKEIAQEHVAGQCTWASHQPNLVTIDLTFWNAASDLQKEFVVFHELGHCFLNRGHREDAFTNGQCASLMRSGLEDCRDNYTSATRSQYLDELFNRNFSKKSFDNTDHSNSKTLSDLTASNDL